MDLWQSCKRCLCTTAQNAATLQQWTCGLLPPTNGRGVGVGEGRTVLGVTGVARGDDYMILVLGVTGVARGLACTRIFIFFALDFYFYFYFIFHPTP